MWRVVKGFIDERTLMKISIHGSDYKKALLEKISEENITDYLGGSLKCTFPNGKDAEFDVGDAKDGTTVLPKTITIAAGKVEEISVTVEIPMSALSFEFTPQKNDIKFSLYRLTEEKNKEYLLDEKKYGAAFAKRLIVDKPGQYILVFDNAHSWLTGKSITYSVLIDKPMAGEEIKIAENTEKKKKKKSKKSKKEIKEKTEDLQPVTTLEPEEHRA